MHTFGCLGLPYFLIVTNLLIPCDFEAADVRSSQRAVAVRSCSLHTRMFPITPNTDTVDTVERVETHTYKSNIAYAVDTKKLKLVNVSESFNTI